MPKGKTSRLENTHFKSSKSLIAAITSKGDWFYSSLTSSNNSKTFISFMEKLLKWIVVDLRSELNKSVILFDNLKVHNSK